MPEPKPITCGVLEGTIAVPSSKSMTHRALILAAFSRRPVRILQPLFSDDTLYTLQALENWGFVVDRHEHDVWFTGEQQLPKDPVHIDVGNSGTTARLLTALAALLPCETIIDGNQRLRQRPIQPLLDALEQLGVKVSSQSGKFPVRIQGGTVKGDRVTIAARESSQFVSALLMLGAFLPEGLRVHLTSPDLPSRAYVDLTVAMLKSAGCQVQKGPDWFSVVPPARWQKESWSIEGDFSSASYFLIAAAITGGRVCITNVSSSSLQGDRVILEILKRVGARVEEDSRGVCVQGHRLMGIDWDMNACPDLVPGVAVMALFAQSASCLRRVEHLQFKESNRLQAIMENVHRLGGKAEQKGADLWLFPQPLKGATLSAYDDHRIAMSFALAGLRVPGVVIDDATCVKKSFPTFWECWEELWHPL